MSLRPYQQQALIAAQDAYRAGHRGVLLVAPTGAGKTAIAAAAIAASLARGRTVLFLAPRREIVRQTSARLTACGVRHGIIAAGIPQPDADAPVQVAMAQTARRRDLPAPDLLVIDEAHLDVYGDIADAFPSAWRLLLTATPLRASRQGWAPLATALVDVETVAGLVAAGHLVAAQVWSAEQPSLAGVTRGAGGEYSPTQAGGRYMASVIMGDTVDQWRRRCRGRPALVFASSVQHSMALRAALRAAGARVAHIDGDTRPDARAATLAMLAAGALDVVCNYGVLCEGLDVPAVSAVIVARATQSEALWRQMVGRGLRPAPGKADCVVIDQGGNAYLHGHPMVPRAWTLDGTEKRARDVDPDAPPAAWTCPACLAILPVTDATCARCGAERETAPRKPPRVLTRKELALLSPDGTARPTYGGRPIRDLPEGVAAVWRPAWEQLELQRLEAGRDWRWSLHRLREKGAAVVIPAPPVWR